MLYLVLQMTLLAGVLGVLLEVADGLHVEEGPSPAVDPIPPLSSLPPARPIAFDVSLSGAGVYWANRMTPDQYGAWHGLHGHTGLDWLAIARV